MIKTNFKALMGIALTASLLASCSSGVKSVKSKTAQAFSGGCITLDVIATNNWGSGYQGAVRITNDNLKGNLTSFEANFTLAGTISGTPWNGTIVSGTPAKASASGLAVAKAASYDIGFVANGTYAASTITNVKVNGTTITAGQACTSDDAVAPTVSLASSSTNVTAAGNITLTATASDNIGVSKVEFYDGTTLLSTDETSPYTATVALTASNNGTKSYTAKAFDAAGNNTTSSAVSVVVNAPPADTTKPTITAFTATPATVTQTGEVVALDVTATDASGIAKVEFHRVMSVGVNPVLSFLVTDAAAPWKQTFAFSSGAANGAFTYVAKVFDPAGNVTTSGYATYQVAIPVACTASCPTITLAASTPTVTTAGGTVTITPTVANVYKVEYYRKGTTTDTLISTKTAKPYTQAFSFADSSKNGTYTYYAKAFKSDGANVTSSNLSFNVNITTAPNCTTPYADPEGDGTGVENGVTCTVVYKTAVQIAADMGQGWNLGNTLDSINTSNLSAVIDETSWGNPMTTQAMVDKLYQTGFRTLRIPVSWDNHTGAAPSFTIDSAWMNRVEEVVKYGLNNNMYVIINIHHNSGWEAPTNANKAAATDRLTKLWAQIATKFGKYGEKLIFETMNEPRVGEDWTGVPEYFAVVNDLNAAAVSTIRAGGANNTKRLIMVPTYVATPSDTQLDALVLPNDSKLAVSVHSYAPYDFALNNQSSATTFDSAVLDTIYSRLSTRYTTKGIAVVMGEWGTINKNNLSERERHATYFVGKAKYLGIPTILWDNNLPTMSSSSEALGYFDRANLTWYFPTIISAIMNATPIQ